MPKVATVNVMHTYTVRIENPDDLSNEDVKMRISDLNTAQILKHLSEVKPVYSSVRTVEVEDVTVGDAMGLATVQLLPPEIRYTTVEVTVRRTARLLLPVTANNNVRAEAVASSILEDMPDCDLARAVENHCEEWGSEDITFEVQDIDTEKTVDKRRPVLEVDL